LTLNLHNLCDIKQTNPVRIRTGFDELDIAYGVNKVYDDFGKEIMWEVGPPRGRLSLWAGAGGVGKSRAAISVCMNMSNLGYVPLYILNEDDPENLASWVKTKNIPDEFYVLGSNQIEDHDQAINELSPDIVIVDSLTGMEHIDSQRVIRDVMLFYKEAAHKYNCHIILISHLNKEGIVKGNSDILYYPDHVCILKPLDFKGVSKDQIDKFQGKGYFMLKFGKNRGGLSNHLICFQHQEDGVILKTSTIIGYNDKGENQ